MEGGCQTLLPLDERLEVQRIFRGTVFFQLAVNELEALIVVLCREEHRSLRITRVTRATRVTGAGAMGMLKADGTCCT